MIVYSVISELVARRGLDIALAGRDETTLEPLFHYLISNITNPAYSGLLIDCCNTLFGKLNRTPPPANVLTPTLCCVLAQTCTEGLLGNP